jgi:hypothetical protein
VKWIINVSSIPITSIVIYFQSFERFLLPPGRRLTGAIGWWHESWRCGSKLKVDVTKKHSNRVWRFSTVWRVLPDHLVVGHCSKKKKRETTPTTIFLLKKIAWVILTGMTGTKIWDGEGQKMTGMTQWPNELSPGTSSNYSRLQIASQNFISPLVLQSLTIHWDNIHIFQ